MDFIESLKDSGVKKISWFGSGFASSYLAHSKAKEVVENLQENSWLGHVMPNGAKKVFAFGAAVFATGATSIAASLISAEENKKYVWFGGLLSLLLIATQELSSFSSSIGNSQDGVENGSGEGRTIIPTSREVLDLIQDFPNETRIQELKKTGFIDAIIENNNTLKVVVGENVIYSPIGSAYIVESHTMEIFLNEILFLIASAPEVKQVEISRSFGDQNKINSIIDKILEQSEKYNKISILRDTPFITWGTVGEN